MDVREKLVELIESARYWGSNTSEEIAENLIENGVMVQEWISVTERLPDKEFQEHRNIYKDEDLEVLAIIKGAKMATALLYNEEGEFYSPDYNGATYYAVTHWMPLPNPPKGE